MGGILRSRARRGAGLATVVVVVASVTSVAFAHGMAHAGASTLCSPASETCPTANTDSYRFSYTGKTITWEKALASTEDLSPKSNEWGELPMPAVATPGKTKFA